MDSDVRTMTGYDSDSRLLVLSDGRIYDSTNEESYKYVDGYVDKEVKHLAVCNCIKPSLMYLWVNKVESKDACGEMTGEKCGEVCLRHG